MKDGETPVLSAKWWKQNEPPGLRSATRLETALRMYEGALRRFDATSAEREAEEVFDALDDVDDAAGACEAEAAKLAKNADRVERMAETVRRYASSEIEPAGVFHAGHDDGR